MTVRRLDVIGQFDVTELGAADHPFLLLDRQRIPGAHIVQILLGDQIAAAVVERVIDDQRCGDVVDRRLGVLGAIHESEQITLIEIAEAVDLVLDIDHAVEMEHQLAGQFETHIRLRSAQVEENVSWRADRRMDRPGQRNERVQPRRPRQIGIRAIPEPRTDAGHAAEPRLGDAEPDRTLKSGHVCEPFTHRLLGTCPHGHGQIDRRLCGHPQDGLCKLLWLRPRHQTALHPPYWSTILGVPNSVAGAAVRRSANCGR
ncbi:hypothetical protein SDC9_128250 [bioreactor metagenome]|uniref:Uncharacterized protein n=1 Tax=bioreactor metagenome TaxID=1076179 RepID=A0A645CWG5_9ZZZZ